MLVTGFDIIFFWVARMMMMGLHFMGDVPFRTVYIHGLVRDERGQKMSKSKGNVMDPLELADAYGTDALRFTLASFAGPGRDVQARPRRRSRATAAFVTKLWNAARFCEMNGIAPDPAFDPAAAATPLARWISTPANAAVAEATAALEAYRLDDYAAALYRFTWGTFCDWFLELAKPALLGPDGAEKAEAKGAAQHVLGVILRLAHPVMPYVTEELWDRFGYGPEGSLIRTPWPAPVAVAGAEEARAELDWLVSFITEVRVVRAEVNVPPSVTVPLLVQGASEGTLARAARWIDPIRRLARATEVRVLEGAAPEGVAQAVVGEATVMLPLAGVVDLAAERARLAKDHAKVEAEARKIATKLANPDFTARAKEEVVEETRERLGAPRPRPRGWPRRWPASRPEDALLRFRGAVGAGGGADPLVPLAPAADRPGPADHRAGGGPAGRAVQRRALRDLHPALRRLSLTGADGARAGLKPARGGRALEGGGKRAAPAPARFPCPTSPPPPSPEAGRPGRARGGGPGGHAPPGDGHRRRLLGQPRRVV